MISDEPKLGEPCLSFFLSSSLRDYTFALDHGEGRSGRRRADGQVDHLLGLRISLLKIEIWLNPLRML